jgi:hypothetical protein
MALNRFKIDPYGLLVGHTWIEVGVILDLINRYDVRRFVELGVHVGGLTAVVTPIMAFKGFEYMAVEINPQISHAVAGLSRLYAGFEFVAGDCLTEDMRGGVHKFVDRSSETAMIYCDNGEKAMEFPFYAPVLRPGDVIAVHDYYGAVPQDVGEGWKPEIDDDVIGPTVHRYGLTPITLPEPVRIFAAVKA